MNRSLRTEPDRPPRPSALNDLMIGLRLSMTGSRESLLRTLLTAVGVGVATAMLLLAAAVPTIMENRDERAADRLDYQIAEYPPPPAADDTLLLALAGGEYEGVPVNGRVLRPEGPDAPVPPGLDALPGPGEMVVSPALAGLLDDPEHDVLKRRLDHPVVGEIRPEGLEGPGELAYYLGNDTLEEHRAVARLTAFGGDPGYGLGNQRILLLGIVGAVVMITPILVFLAAAVRFGGEQRDRRLAALRLMGADRAATRRIAAGETLSGTLLGLLFGVAFFLAGRPLVELVPIESGVFTSDVVPGPVLAALVFAVVPVLSLWVALIATRGVAVEPLGVVRRAEQRRPRLWWRIALPLVGAALILVASRTPSNGLWGSGLVLFVIGILAVLLGSTAVMPWLVARFFGRPSSGPVSLQLALRRLGAGGGGPARAVSGIVVTVAGAIALQSLLSAVEAVDETAEASYYGSHVYEGVAYGDRDFNLRAYLPSGVNEGDPVSRFEAAPGVEEAFTFAEAWGGIGIETTVSLRVADCAVLLRMADLPGCAPGDVFASEGAPEPGDTLSLGHQPDPYPWTVPEYSAIEGDVASPEFESGDRYVLATPEALSASDAEAFARAADSQVWLRIDPTVPEMKDEVVAAAYGLDPIAAVEFLDYLRTDSELGGVRNMLLAGAIASVALIVAGMTVTTIEQVRERHRVHAVLTAFGIRRRTLVGSVLWQTALPVLLGITVASVTGLALGTVLMGLYSLPVSFNPADVLVIAASGAVAVFLATLVSVPALLRTTSPEGLRSE